MGKKTTTLWLDEDLVKRCKELNINISSTVETILKIILEKHPLNEEEIRLAILLGEKHRLVQELDKCEEAEKALHSRIGYYDQLITKQKKLVSEIKRSNEIARLMRVLNAKIKAENYDITKIKQSSAEVLKHLASYNLPTDDVWLSKQIERIKRLHY